MIFYKNIKKSRKSTQKNLTFSIFADGVDLNKDDSIALPNSCKMSYNLTMKDGALKTGLGFQNLRVPASLDDLENCHEFDLSSIDEICGLWLDRWFSSGLNDFVYQIVFLDASNIVWGALLLDSYEGCIFQKSTNLKSAPVYACEYRMDDEDCQIFFSNEGMLRLGYTTVGYYVNVPAMISCVVHYDNFFGITNSNRNRLVYTTDLNLSAWNNENSSTIEFLDNRGAFTKLISFNDYVYLFREKGITKISLYSSHADFSFTHLYSSTSKIYEDSVCVCGDKVFFVTRDGLFTFNGASVQKVNQDYDNLFLKMSNDNCTCACLNGKYYFATKCDFDDGKTVGCENGTYVNNTLFVVDIEDFTLEIYRGVDIRNLVAVDSPYMSKLCASFYNNHKQQIGELVQNGKTFENVNEKFWRSHKTDLGEIGKRKHITEIFIKTKYPCDFVIESDEETKTYSFDGSDDLQRLSVSVYGTYFEFTFSTNQEFCEICKPTVNFDVVS